MISPEYCRVMARYNAWQNRQLAEALEAAPLEVLTRDRGAFFGSILGTLNHILWGDLMWMSRLNPSVAAPGGGIAESSARHPTPGAWSAERFHLDGKIRHWAEALGAIDLVGSLRWHSAAAGREMSKPVALCVAHMFNHQTHHRGQVHAMMTAAGLQAPVTDLFLMPETRE